MLADVLGAAEVETAGVAKSGRQGHLLRHASVRHLILNRAGRAVSGLPGRRSARRQLNVPAERSLAGLLFFCEGVVVVGQKSLARGHVNLALVFGHEFVPADMAGVGAVAGILHVELRLLAY
jgi:hypothetical protein